MKDDITLYFAHHEKLCLIDGEVAFMGGLDLCFGRVSNSTCNLRRRLTRFSSTPMIIPLPMHIPMM